MGHCHQAREMAQKVKVLVTGLMTEFGSQDATSPYFTHLQPLELQTDTHPPHKQINRMKKSIKKWNLNKYNENYYIPVRSCYDCKLLKTIAS